MGVRREQRAAVVRAKALGPSVAEWLHAFVEQRARERYNVKSERVMVRTHVKGDELGRTPLAALSPAAVRAWWSRMTTKPARAPRQMPLPGIAPRGLSASTLRNVLSLVRCALAEAVGRGLLAANPADGLGVPRPARASTELELDGVLEPDEQTAVARALAGAIWKARTSIERVEARAASAMVRVALGTGLRRGELLSLRWEDVDLVSEAPHLRVRFGGKGRATKGGRARRVPLFGVALEALSAWRSVVVRHDEVQREVGPVVEVQIVRLDAFVGDVCALDERVTSLGDARPQGEVRPPARAHVRQSSALVFPGPRGGRRKGPPVRALRAALRAAGVTRRVRFHDLRHTCATSLLEGWWGRQWSTREVKELLGHASETTTERYVHARGSLVFRAAREQRGSLPSRQREALPPRGPLSTPVDTRSGPERHALARAFGSGVALEVEARSSVMGRGDASNGHGLRTERDTGLESERHSYNPCDVTYRR